MIHELMAIHIFNILKSFSFTNSLIPHLLTHQCTCVLTQGFTGPLKPSVSTVICRWLWATGGTEMLSCVVQQSSWKQKLNTATNLLQAPDPLH